MIIVTSLTRSQVLQLVQLTLQLYFPFTTKYVDFPIKTRVDRNEPRLVTITADVNTSYVVAFDSYMDSSPVEPYADTITSENNGSKLQQDDSTLNDNPCEKEHHPSFTMYHEDGLMVEHVLASASVPLGYDYQQVPTNDGKFKSRAFWDGGILSNTPLREFLVRHYYYWTDRLDSNFWNNLQAWKNGDNTALEKLKQGKLYQNRWVAPDLDQVITTITDDDSQQGKQSDLIPNLDVYIVDLWPSLIKEELTPTAFDITKARMLDIMMGDKTHYDQIVTEAVTDYSNLAKKIRTTVKNSAFVDKDKVGSLMDEIDKILEEDTNANRSSEGRSKFIELLAGQFDVDKVFRVKRAADINAIFNMMMDFSTETINNMWTQGRDDAIKEIIRHNSSMLSLNEKIIDKETLDKYQNELDDLQKLLRQACDSIMDVKSDTHYEDALEILEEYHSQVEQFKKNHRRDVISPLKTREDKERQMALKRFFNALE